jgi:hypothetical protein
MRNILKSKKRRIADLKRRTERITRIITAAGAKALDRDPELGKMLTSPELQEALAWLGTLNLEQAEIFIETMESGVPAEFRHIK